ncbi:MAG: universal stress protein [Candidatus Bipolaricaulota bacterium]
MLPVKKVLCPTDFSDPSARGLAAAVEIAQAENAELLIVHVVGTIPAVESPSGAAAFDIASYQDELVRSARAALEERRRRRVPEGVKARTLVSVGDAAHEIARIAEDEGVDLIVVSTHGKTGWRERIFGSVAEKIVRLARCSVLTIPCYPAGSCPR